MPMRVVASLTAFAALMLALPMAGQSRWDLNGDASIDASDLACAVRENAEANRVCSSWPSVWPEPNWRASRDLALVIQTLDQDGDGFSDWFEAERAQTPPSWFNGRHVVLAIHYLLPPPDQLLAYYLPFLPQANIHPIYEPGLEAQHRFYELMDELKAIVQPADHLWVFIQGSGGISYSTQVGYYEDMFDAIRPIVAARKIIVITGCYDTSIHYSASNEQDVMVLNGTAWFRVLSGGPSDYLGGPDTLGNGDGYISLAEVQRHLFEYRLWHLEQKGIYPQTLLDQVRADPSGMLDEIVDWNLQVPMIWDPQGLAEETYLGEWVGDY